MPNTDFIFNFFRRVIIAGIFEYFSYLEPNLNITFDVLCGVRITDYTRIRIRRRKLPSERGLIWNKHKCDLIMIVIGYAYIFAKAS
jgi:hypothetical protein